MLANNRQRFLGSAKKLLRRGAKTGQQPNRQCLMWLDGFFDKLSYFKRASQ